MIIGVPREISPGERRVALIPDAVRQLVEKGLEIQVQTGAGEQSGIDDQAYKEAGARIESDAAALFASSDVLVKVQPPELQEVEALREGVVLICVLQPFSNLELISKLVARRISALGLDLMPRITRAQSMDVLSSMSTLAGYRSVLIAAQALPKIFPLLTTAAGTLRPARVLVLGAGVAGLQAIATARRLGAIVEGFDIRPAAKEQVESLGARFVQDESLDQSAETAGGYAKELSAEQQARQRENLSKHMAESDVVICTALVPGRKAPVLMTEEQVRAMAPGSVVVDLAAEQGGNCEPSIAGEIVRINGVEIHGPVNIASGAATHASQMFSRNVLTYLGHLARNGELELSLDDELVSGPLVTHEGRVMNEAIQAALEA